MEPEVSSPLWRQQGPPKYWYPHITTNKTTTWIINTLKTNFRWTHSTSSCIISLSSILILNSHLCLGLPNGVFSSGFTDRSLRFPALPCVMHACLVHLIVLDFITLTIFVKQHKLFSSSCRLLQPPATSSLSGPNIPLSALFPDTVC